MPPLASLEKDLDPRDQNLLGRYCRDFHLSQSRAEQLFKYAKDLRDWNEIEPLRGLLSTQLDNLAEQREGRPRPHPDQRKRAWEEIEAFYEKKQSVPPNFQRPAPKPRFSLPSVETLTNDNPILGPCPVRSEKTRCCNLQVLDVIQQCGFNCSYCAVQHFYNEKAVQVHSNLEEKLSKIRLDPEKWYHIGTGQASDSLLWSDKFQVIKPLLRFAESHPRVILEFKTKSANVEPLLAESLPPNILMTWSLNPDPVIAHEESLTPSVHARLRAARQMADRGVKVGFHFHPIIRFQGWKTEYGKLAEQLCQLFSPEEVVTVSLGTLTFSKANLKTIRKNGLGSQILRFPMEEIAGKYSYPYKIKREMFQHVYQALKAWHNRVFFYLCMEDKKLWPEVFGYDYASNEEFEAMMIQAYRKKIEGKISIPTL